MRNGKNKENDIIKKAAQGDEGAWEYIYTKYRKALLSYIRYHFSHIDYMEAEDILHETLENIVKKEKLKTYDPARVSFYRFLIYMTRYEILHYFDRTYKKIQVKGKDHRIQLVRESDISEKKDTKDEFVFEEQLSVIFYKQLVEYDEVDIEELLKLLTLYTSAGPPHQLLAFGFNRLIAQWRKKPKKIVSELSHEFLKYLTDLLIQDFIKEIHSGIPGKKADVINDYNIKDCFSSLKRTMDEQVKTVLSAGDDKTRYHIDLMKITGKTCLEEYYTGKPEKHISDWTDKVMKRLTKLWEEATVDRSKTGNKG
jgi:DNA-directed RNA polymerase specialized sigma24 family protein